MIHYTLSFAQYHQHLIQVSVKFKAQPQQKIWLPTWIPGSYLIREFARHVERMTACEASVDSNSNDSNSTKLTNNNSKSKLAITVQKITKNQWQLHNQQAVDVELSYQVYAYDLSVRGAYIDDERLYVNPAAVCVGVEGQEQQAIELSLDIPKALSHFSLATGLKQCVSTQIPYVLNAKNYSELIDQPFELATQTTLTFNAESIEHRVAISGRHQTNITRLTSDLNKICSAQIKLFGDAPFDDYLFMVMATANSYGGLEHQNSTSLITPRDDLPKADEPEQPSTNYRRFLGLCSHEYFHSWMVKFIRPHNYITPNLHQEEYTTLLWVFEGITSYYDDLMLLRSGVIDEAAYLDLLKEQISRYLSNPGRHVQSVAESSFDAWIKFYRPDENSSNAGTSYYNKGALVALCLDLSLRQHGANLDQLLQTLYTRAKNGQQVNETTLADICQVLTGQSMQQFFDDYVDGTTELPLESLLAQVGVDLQREDKIWPLGLKVQENAQGLLVQQVLRDSVGAAAGISAHDTIIALNGLKANNSLLQQVGSHIDSHQDNDNQAEKNSDNAGQAPSIKLVTCHLFRRDELKTVELSGVGSIMHNAKLQLTDKSLLKLWINY